MSPRPPRAVVVGASAGAVEAVGGLLAGLPAGFEPAVVVVVHLPPDRPSLLARIFAGRCALPVVEAEDKQPLAGGAVFIAPPDYHLLVEREARLALSRDGWVHFSRPSIDVLFESAAAALGDRVAGVLMTGASADGAAGLRSIALAGGATAVEDPDTAYASTMPRAALALMRPDLVGDVAALTRWVRALSPTPKDLP